MVIPLMAISGYSINDYWFRICLMVIGGFFYWLLVDILLMTIDAYSIGGYWWILVDIGDY
jgi:hypothetical protein